MKSLSLLLLLPSLTIGTSLWCQQTTPSPTARLDLPDSPTPHLASADNPAPDSGTMAPNHHGYPTDREESWKTLPKDFLHDQKLIWAVFPGQMATGHHWIPVLATTGVTAGLLYADPHVMPYFRDHEKNLGDLNSTFNSSIAAGEIAALPVGLLAAGYVRHDPYEVSTALLAADAYADSAIVSLGIKTFSRRVRPIDVPLRTPFQDTFFKGKWFKGSSFPSGHSAAAFSVATVVAHRYSNHKWVPVLAYGMATVISLSRVSTLAHYPSDVFLGAVIGYTTAEYAALRPR